jgi:hypothetical protein
MSRESELTIGFALIIAMGCGVSNAAAQTDKYPRMAGSELPVGRLAGVDEQLEDMGTSLNPLLGHFLDVVPIGRSSAPAHLSY